MSDKYKAITDLGLEVIGAGMSNYAAVKANDLLALLEKGTKIYGRGVAESNLWSPVDSYNATHVGLLIDFKPLHEAVSKSELLEKLKKVNSGEIYEYGLLDGLINRIEKAGVK